MNHFVDSSEFWDETYKNSVPPWDLNGPTPAFLDLLKEKKFIPHSKMLVLGSGFGHDAIAAAKQNLDVTAVDFSETAIRHSIKLAKENNVKVNFLAEDLFILPRKYQEEFDLIYDYVTLCAINPSRREEYAKTVSSLLKKKGYFIIILFPVEIRVAGPPFGIDEIQMKEIFSKYFTLVERNENINSIKPRRGREILHIYRKEN